MPASTAILQTSRPGSGNVRLREIEEADVADVARIAFEAFADIADRHGFPRDFPTDESALELVGAFAEHPAFWGVVAELDGRVIGSAFLDERAVVRGFGPITVAPPGQALGVGRQLTAAALTRAGSGVSVRLLQDSFNVASLGLYASLGFVVVEQVALVGGIPRRRPARVDVRALVEDDLAACRRLCTSVLGYDRTVELSDALAAPGLEPVVAVRGRRIVAYATTFADFGLSYAVGESEDDLFALIARAVTPEGPPASFLLPLRQHALVRQCLGAGLRFVKPMTYMVAGPDRRPRGAWIPSVLS